MADKRAQIINFRGMDVNQVEANLRPLLTGPTAPGIKIQIINIEDLDMDQLGESLRVAVACCIVATRTAAVKKDE